jgi:hypothetical protein
MAQPELALSVVMGQEAMPPEGVHVLTMVVCANGYINKVNM